MYQMYAYSKKYGASEIWLIYPANMEMRDHEDISFKSDDGVKVKLFFVDVADIEGSLLVLRSQLQKTRRPDGVIGKYWFWACRTKDDGIPAGITIVEMIEKHMDYV